MKQLFNEDAIKRTLVRISHEILEKNKGCDNLVLVGILTRGAYLAKRIQENIEKFEGVQVPCGCIDITIYRDDKKVENYVDKTEIPFEIKGKKVVLIDDVLFRGRTVRAAMEGVMKIGRPSEIQLMALVDRGHRELPIRADYVGKNIPTGLHESVELHLKEIDNEDALYIKEV